MLTVHVQPGAKTSAVAGLYGDALKIRIAAPAVDNKANAALVAFLGESLGVRQSAIRIRQGSTGRRKVVEIVDASEVLVTRLRCMVLAPPR
jgi:uncharacterized protein